MLSYSIFFYQFYEKFIFSIMISNRYLYYQFIYKSYLYELNLNLKKKILFFRNRMEIQRMGIILKMRDCLIKILIMKMTIYMKILVINLKG